MAVTITDNRTTLDQADALTNFNQGEVNTSDYAESTGSIALSVNIATDQIFFNGTTPNFITSGNELIYIWSAMLATQNVWNAGSGGASHAIWLSDGTNAIILYNAGSDRIVFQHSIDQVLFQCMVIDVDYLDAKNTAGEIYAVIGSYASFDPTSIIEVGMYYVTLSKALGGGVNCYIDIIRYGTEGISITGGTTSDRGSFAEIAAADRSSVDGAAHGILREYTVNTYGCQGTLKFGTTGIGDSWFDDSGFSLTFEDRDVGDDKWRLMVLGNVTAGEETNIYLANGTIASARPGVEVDMSSTGINVLSLDSVVFSKLGRLVSFPIDSASYNHDIVNCTFDGCDTIDAGATTFTGNKVVDSVAVADTSAVLWNVATDPDGYLDNLDVTKGTNAHHAIEFGISSPLTMTIRGMTSSGFNASDGQTDSTFHVKRTTGNVTINVIDSTGNFSYKSAGATVTVIVSPVTTQITVKDVVTGSVIENARVLLEAADGTGPMNYQVSVTSIARSGSTATVTQTAHGLSTNDWVHISGANQDEYNGVFQITVTGTDTYTYTVSGTPVTPATGTITETDALFNTLTNASGIVTDTRTYASNQPVVGRVRKSTTTPLYKSQPVVGTIDSNNGLTLTVQLIPDE